MLDLLNGFDFPWYYQDNISNKGNENSLKEFGFSHIFVDKNTKDTVKYAIPFNILKNKPWNN